MNFLNDLISEMKERIRNPLMSSFVMSWLIWNWFFLYVLCFADVQDVLNYANETTKTAYILTLLTWNSCLWWPLASSLVYTLLMPLIKGWIHLFLVWRKKRINVRVEKNRRGDFVLYEKHLALHQKLEKERMRVVVYSKTEMEKDGIIEEMKTEKEDLQKTINNKLDELVRKDKVQLLTEQVIQFMNKVSNLNGEWYWHEYNSKDFYGNNRIKGKTKIRFSNHEGYFLDDSGVEHNYFEINVYFFNVMLEELYFGFKSKQPALSYGFEPWYNFKLKIGSSNKHEGIQNGDTKVVFESLLPTEYKGIIDAYKKT
jgi:hypothetical protein